MNLYHTPKNLAESSLVSIPSNDLNRPRPKVSRVMNLNAARHVIFVSWIDIRVAEDSRGFCETECILLVETDYLFIRFWSRLFNSVLSSPSSDSLLQRQAERRHEQNALGAGRRLVRQASRLLEALRRKHVHQGSSDSLQLLTSVRERFFVPLRNMTFEGPGVSVESLDGSQLGFRAESELVEYYESLESSLG